MDVDLALAITGLIGIIIGAFATCMYFMFRPNYYNRYSMEEDI